MPLTPEEQKELEALEMEFSGGLTPQEQQELTTLEQEFSTPQKEVGLIGRLGEDVSRRAQQVGQIEQDYASGQISKPEEIYTKMGSAAGLVGDVSGELMTEALKAAKMVDELTGGYGGATIGGVVRGIGSLPAGGAGTLGERIPQEVNYLLGIYEDYKKTNPREARLIESTGNIALMLPAIKYADDIIESGGKVKKAISKSEIAKLTSDDIREQGSKLYKLADQKGGELKSEFVDEFTRRIQKIQPQTDIGRALAGTDKATELTQKLQDFSSQPITFQGLKEVDEILGELAYDTADNFGKLSREGKKLLDMQTELRSLVEEASSDMFLGGREAFDIAKEARKYWSASLRLRDVERIIQRAEGANQPSTVIRNGFRALRDNPKRMKGFTPAEVFAVKKAANTGTLEAFLKLGGSGLVPIAAGAATIPAGGAGAIPAFIYQQVSKRGAEAIKGRQAENVKNVIKSRVVGDQVPTQKLLPALGEFSAGVSRATQPAGVADVIQNQFNQETMSDRARRLYGVNE